MDMCEYVANKFGLSRTEPKEIYLNSAETDSGPKLEIWQVSAPKPKLNFGRTSNVA